MTIKEAAKKAYATACAKGFWADDHDLSFYRQNSVDRILAKLALITSEVGEAVEEVRTGDKIQAFGDELADIIIRTLDLGHACGIDMEIAIMGKLDRNTQREYRHGGKRA